MIKRSIYPMIWRLLQFILIKLNPNDFKQVTRLNFGESIKSIMDGFGILCEWEDDTYSFI